MSCHYFALKPHSQRIKTHQGLEHSRERDARSEGSLRENRNRGFSSLVSLNLCDSEKEGESGDTGKFPLLDNKFEFVRHSQGAKGTIEFLLDFGEKGNQTISSET